MEAPGPVAWWNREPLRRCPARLVPAWAWEVMALYGPWTRGNLPESGGVLDQVATVTDALRIIEAAVADVRAEEQDKADAARQNPGGTTVIAAAAPVRPSIRK